MTTKNWRTVAGFEITKSHSDTHKKFPSLRAKKEEEHAWVYIDTSIMIQMLRWTHARWTVADAFNILSSGGETDFSDM